MEAGIINQEEFDDSVHLDNRREEATSGHHEYQW